MSKKNGNGEDDLPETDSSLVSRLLREKAGKRLDPDPLGLNKYLDPLDKDRVAELMEKADALGPRDEYDELLDGMIAEREALNFDGTVETAEEIPTFDKHLKSQGDELPDLSDLAVNPFDEIEPLDERHRPFVDLIKSNYLDFLEFPLPGQNSKGLLTDVVNVKINAESYLRTLRDVLAIMKCMEPTMQKFND